MVRDEVAGRAAGSGCPFRDGCHFFNYPGVKTLAMANQLELYCFGAYHDCEIHNRLRVAKPVPVLLGPEGPFRRLPVIRD